jgi:hypothetical protein
LARDHIAYYHVAYYHDERSHLGLARPTIEPRILTRSSGTPRSLLSTLGGLRPSLRVASRRHGHAPPYPAVVSAHLSASHITNSGDAHAVSHARSGSTLPPPTGCAVQGVRGYRGIGIPGISDAVRKPMGKIDPGLATGWCGPAAAARLLRAASMSTTSPATATSGTTGMSSMPAENSKSTVSGRRIAVSARATTNPKTLSRFLILLQDASIRPVRVNLATADGRW